MADLHVDVGGLRSAAGSSVAVAAGLAAGADTGVCTDGAGSDSSKAGVAAMNAAVAAVHTRHGTRIGGHADAVSISGAVYERTDTDGGDSITVSV